MDTQLFYTLALGAVTLGLVLVLSLIAGWAAVQRRQGVPRNERIGSRVSRGVLVGIGFLGFAVLAGIVTSQLF